MPLGGDRDRALIEKGRWTSRRIGAFCRDQDRPPTLVLCSPSRRTLETCEFFCEGLRESVRRRVVDGLYAGSPETLLRAVTQASDRHDAVLLIGHNPGLQSLAIALGRHGPGPAFARLSGRFPPAALAIFETGVDRWAAFASESARLVRFTTVKELG